MIQKEIDGVVILNAEGAIGKRIGIHGGCEFVCLTVNPGGIVAPHRIDFPVTFYVIEGEGSISIEGRNGLAEKGDLVEVPAGAQRQWRNMGGHTLSLLAIKHTSQGA
jgi:mannose-6-phosphate isomerase-like protein (cupin superfamily)